MTILINPCGRTGETVAKSLRNSGEEVKLVEGPNPRKFEAFYIRTLKETVERTGADCIIPVFFADVLAAHRDEFPGINIPVSDAGTLLRLDDKRSACALAAELGIPQPRIYDGFPPEEAFPVVFKRPMGQGGDSVYFPKTPAALKNLLKTAGDYIISDYVEGDNYSVDALRWDGFFFAAAYRSLSEGKGVSRERISVRQPLLEEYVRKILDAVDYRGVCGVDFRVNAEGAWFLECNPRFSGGLESAIESGFDIPALLLGLSRGERADAAAIRFREGIITH